MGKYFDDFEVGEESFTAGRTITEADVVNFAALTGDWNEIHTNKEFASRGPFGQRIATERWSSRWRPGCPSEADKPETR
jgi:3-hydroxybutyryl-CoA dehydratase